ncbi:hypothetical protein [Nocardia sp. XZ_19_385]|uniref:hypothetical protein n=1 Tax=Nocardia sp. XZ_19_385 TaxID=2769488 RepID=UPI00188EF396|nr:hypothetical protein [Nocardia sp. XZ_19_385]
MSYQPPSYAPYPPPAQPKSADGTAGILAGTFGMLTGLAYAALTFNAIHVRREVQRDWNVRLSMDFGELVLWSGYGLASVLLLFGSVLLLCRTVIGRVLVIIGCVIAISATGLYTLAQLIDSLDNRHMSTSSRAFAVLFTLGFAIPPAAVLGLASVRATGRWIRGK